MSRPTDDEIRLAPSGVWIGHSGGVGNRGEFAVVEDGMAVVSLAPITRLAAIVAAFLAVAACGDGATSSSGAGSRGDHSASSAPAGPIGDSRAIGTGTDARPTPPPPPLTLYVSNQSFDDPNVQIAVSIDGVVVVDQSFAVEGQHNWITFEPDVPPGDHTLTATSNTGAELTVEFATKAGQPRWAVVNYWWYPGDGPREFTFDISDEPIGFG
jgi:hypothetical protein